MNKYNIIKKIGNGAYGTTYKVEYNNKFYALKKQKILESDTKKNLKSNIWREIEFYKWINKLSKLDQIFFMKLYEFNIENSCDLNQDIDNNKLNRSKICLNLLVDLKDGVLKDLNLSTNENNSLLIQMLYIIYLLRKSNWIHRDIHPGNIGYKIVDVNTKVIIKINNKLFKIPTYGYIFSIIDYGMCINKKFLKSSIEKKNYKLNYSLNFDLWCFLEEYIFNYYNNIDSLKRNNTNIKKIHDDITKYVYMNNKLLYEKIKFMMIHINNSLESKFKLLESRNKCDYLISYDFAQYVQIYSNKTYYDILQLNYKDNMYNNNLLDYIKMNKDKIDLLLINLLKLLNSIKH
jgi:serine/threonine protein kinase